MAKYLSKVSKHVIVMDIPGGTKTIASKITASTQLAIPRSSSAARAIFAGTDITPTAKSKIDRITIRK